MAAPAAVSARPSTVCFELQPGGEDQRGPPLPSVARSMVQPLLTQADKIMLIWLAGMEVRRPEEKVAASFTSEAGEDPLGSVP